MTIEYKTWSPYLPWASYQISKLAGCACARNAGNVFPHHQLQKKPIVSDPGLHHGTCVTHVPWCMSVSLTRGSGVNVPGIPSECAPAILRIGQEAHLPLIIPLCHAHSHRAFLLWTGQWLKGFWPRRPKRLLVWVDPIGKCYGLIGL